MKYIIGLDIGTSSTKAIAFDLAGKILAENQLGYPIINDQPSYFEQDPEEIFQAVIQTIAFVSNAIQLNVPSYELAGISFSSAMHSLIAVDRTGTPLTQCIIWADTRSREYARKIKSSTEGHDIYMKTGTPVHPMSPLCKIAWMKDNLPEVFKNTYKFIGIKEYVFFKLFNTYLIDHSIASATGLFNIHTLEWYAPALSVAGVSAQHLSTPVPVTHVTTGIKSSYIDLMKIDPDTAFIIGGSDGCLANLGSNAVKPGDAAATIGTSGAIRVIAEKPNPDPQERIFSYILLPEKYVLGGAINSGGVILRWFRDNFAELEMEEAAKSRVDVYSLLTSKASLIDPGAEGLIFLPYLMGERAPFWNAEAKGMFFGIQLNHSKAHFVRAVMEGIIFALYNVGRALEETTGNINKIYVNGGFVRSSMWVQMLADVFNKEVVVTKSFESSALGAALVGLNALGIFSSIDETGDFVPVAGSFLPNEENHRIYMKNYAVFRRLYDKLKDEFAPES